MDLVAFTDFVLAWDHRSHPAAIKYFFPIVDLQNRVGGREGEVGADSKPQAGPVVCWPRAVIVHWPWPVAVR